MRIALEEAAHPLDRQGKGLGNEGLADEADFGVLLADVQLSLIHI